MAGVPKDWQIDKPATRAKLASLLEKQLRDEPADSKLRSEIDNWKYDGEDTYGFSLEEWTNQFSFHDKLIGGIIHKKIHPAESSGGSGGGKGAGSEDTRLVLDEIKKVDLKIDRLAEVQELRECHLSHISDNSAKVIQTALKVKGVGNAVKVPSSPEIPTMEWDDSKSEPAHESVYLQLLKDAVKLDPKKYVIQPIRGQTGLLNTDERLLKLGMKLKLTGTCDVAIYEYLLFRAMGHCVAAVALLIEFKKVEVLKEEKRKQCQTQAMGQALAAAVNSVDVPPVVLLTDGVEEGIFYWLDGDTIMMWPLSYKEAITVVNTLFADKKTIFGDSASALPMYKRRRLQMEEKRDIDEDDKDRKIRKRPWGADEDEDCDDENDDDDYLRQHNMMRVVRNTPFLSDLVPRLPRPVPFYIK